MKKVLYVIVFSLVTLSSFGQIKIMPSNEQIKKSERVVYDSLSNFKLNKYGDTYTFHHLIGQTIMYCGYPYSTYRTFPFVIGEYYKVDGILPDDIGRGLYNRLVLTNIKSGKVLYEGALGHREYNFKWIVQGYYEKMKSLYVDRDFVYVGTSNDSYRKQDNIINVETDTVTTIIKKRSVWTCVDVQIKPRTKNDRMDIDYRSPLVLIFNNDQYGKHYCYVEDELGRTFESISDDKKPLLCGKFQDKDYYYKTIALNKEAAIKRKTEMIKKYGDRNGSLVAQGKIAIGMTKQMCKDSWGRPNLVNVTTTALGSTEQWVYGHSYVYFENGVITTIQN